MRRLRRPLCTVPTLADEGIAGKKRLQHRAAYETDSTVPSSFEPYWSRPDVRGMLHAMQGRVCSYCGIRTNGLDVEHFRPKGHIEGDPDHGGYWWLAYEATNYFLGCTVCNQKRKKNRFPLAAGTPRVSYDRQNQIGHEARILFDPALDPVEEWLSLEWNDVTCRLVPAPTLPQSQQRRVEEVIDFFGLNLDPELRKQRSIIYEDSARAARDQRWEDLRRMSMRHCPHSFVARFVLLEVAPSQAPSSEDGLRNLLHHLRADLCSQVREIQDLKDRGKLPSPQDLRQLESLCWALIILQKDPPANVSVPDVLSELLEQENPRVRTDILLMFQEIESQVS